MLTIQIRIGKRDAITRGHFRQLQ